MFLSLSWVKRTSPQTGKPSVSILNEIPNNNDFYHGLEAVEGLIMTGATGTNVNDVTVVLCK